jgi:bacterioferritin (cytochrome b1)
MPLKSILSTIVNDNTLHAKWLNTLSYMENAGAKKISASEHKEDVNLIILKHAAEEHRHAYYLKKQLEKLEGGLCKTYKSHELLTPDHTRFYLNALDIAVCRYLKKEFNLEGFELKFAAYLFVTYAIEVRADELYPIYQEVLTDANSRVTVKSIILEEEGHLEEMLNQLKTFSPEWEHHAQIVVGIEQKMFENWIHQLGLAINTTFSGVMA